MRDIHLDGSLRGPEFRDPSSRASETLACLRASEGRFGGHDIPHVDGAARLGSLALRTPRAAVVLCPSDVGDRVPITFIVDDTRTALGFQWPVVWEVTSASFVDAFDGETWTEVCLVEGAATIPFLERDDLWHALVPNALCSRHMALY